MTKTIISILTSVVLFQAKPGKISGTWKLIQYKDVITGITENEPAMYKGLDVMTFQFSDNDSCGTFKGKTVQNDTQGTYLLGPGNKVHVTTFGGTKKGESEWGGKFWYTIRESSSYLLKGDTLTLFYRGEKKSMVFVKKNGL